MKEEIRKYKKTWKIRHLVYLILIFSIATLDITQFVFTLVELNSFVELFFADFVSVIVLILAAVFFTLLVKEYKQRKEIQEGYKKESETKYGEINNRSWIEALDEKQKKIKRKRTNIFWIINGTLLSIFIPFLVILIIIGADEQNSLAIASLIIVIISGALLLVPIIFLVYCYVALKLKVYEIEGTTIVGLMFIDGIELHLESRKIGIYNVSGNEDTFTTDNGIELTYSDGLIYKKEDNPDLKKS